MEISVLLQISFIGILFIQGILAGGYQVSFLGDEYFNPQFYLCNTTSIVSFQNSTSKQSSIALVEYSEDYSTRNIMKVITLDVEFPTNGIVQTDGDSKCYLYFVSQDSSLKLTAHLLTFADLTHTYSEPLPTTQQITATILQQDDNDPNDNFQNRIFFIRNTNLYFIDNGKELKWNSNIDGISILTVSRFVIAGVDSNKAYKLLTFTQEIGADAIMPQEIILQIPSSVYGSIGNILEANILEQQNFIEKKPYHLLIYDKSNSLVDGVQSYIYWVLLIENNTIKQVKYKLPNYYAVMMQQNTLQNSPKCINYKSITDPRRELQMYTALCPKYVLISGYKSDTNNRYSLFINNNDASLFIQYYFNNTIVINLYQQMPNSVNLTQYLKSPIPCISQPTYIIMRPKHSNNTIIQIVCSQSQYEYYTIKVSFLRKELPLSQTWSEVLKYLSITTFSASVICIIVLYIKKKKNFIEIHNQYEYLQAQQRKLYLDAEQFKEKFTILEDESLGRGTFGSVFVCIEKPNKIALAFNKKLKEQKRAVKKIMMRKENKGSEKEEVSLLRQLQTYESVIRLYNYHIANRQLYIVMELAQSSLESEIEQRQKEEKHYTKQEILAFCKQIGYLIRDLHCNKAVTHRDLKPQNILIANDLYKLSDFGAARALNLEDFYRQNTHVGSLRWMSPEMREGVEENNIIQKYKLNYYKCDVFSLGLILMRMLTLQNINGVNQDEECMEMKVQKMMNIRKDIGVHLLQVVADMLRFDLKTRIEMSAFKVNIENIIKQDSEQTQQINFMVNENLPQQPNNEDEYDQTQQIVAGGSSIRNVPVGGENSSINIKEKED